MCITIGREVRARYTASTIRVYQAYQPEIAHAALRAGRFVPPFKMDRMTWIKPSFNWMMYRCGYGTKEGQEVVLGIDITREGFEWALSNAVLSHFDQDVHESQESWSDLVRKRLVRVQWDPERNWRIEPINGVRAIQIGLTGEAVERYVNEWVVGMEDVTPRAKEIHVALKSGATPPYLLDQEEIPYPLPDSILRHIVPAVC
jgi:hypothetical protein